MGQEQSGIRYLKTEAGIGRAAGVEIPCALRLFDLEGIGVHRARLLRQLGPSFERLSWDPYDVKREQVAFLKDRFPGEAAWLEQFLRRYWRGETTIVEAGYLVGQLLRGDQILFSRIRCYRRRSIARFELTNRGSGSWGEQWRVVQVECHGFGQDVDVEDIRSEFREVDPTAMHVAHHPDFQVLLLAMAEMVEDAERAAGRDIHEMSVTFHQMGLVPSPDRTVGNSPEGLHQDGADYIISALVVGRENLDGGESQVRLGKEGPVVFRHTLQPGEGIFQADQGSPLWHLVTPVTIVDHGAPSVRNIFGFDATLKR